MTIKELKERERGLLNSHSTRCAEYGRAYKDVVALLDRFNDEHLSEEVFISDLAQELIVREEARYKLTKNENHLMHIKALSELVITEFVSCNFIKEFFKDHYGHLSFNDAKRLMRNESFYKRVNPTTLVKALEDINVPDSNS